MLFNCANWSPTNNKKIISISKCDSLRKIINHQFGDRCRLLGLISLKLDKNFRIRDCVCYASTRAWRSFFSTSFWWCDIRLDLASIQLEPQPQLPQLKQPSLPFSLAMDKMYQESPLSNGVIKWTSSLMMWMGEANSLTTRIKTMAIYKNSKSFRELWSGRKELQ